MRHVALDATNIEVYVIFHRGKLTSYEMDKIIPSYNIVVAL